MFRVIMPLQGLLLIVVLLSDFLTATEFSLTAMDDIYFDIHWSGTGDPSRSPPADKPTEDLVLDDKSFVITSADKEKYYCVLPSVIKTGAEDGATTYVGPQEYELLTPLFEQVTCSYRIESYWTYELCHAKHLRQYHEDKELKQQKTKIQEYFLGTFDKLKGKEAYMKPVPAPPEAKAEDLVISQKVPIMRLENTDFAYFQMNFTSGTACDVTGGSRRTAVKYICHEDGRGEMYEIKETSSCEYEVVVLTSLLCEHPAYQQKTEPVNGIQCHPLSGAPKRPKAMETFQEDYGRTTVFSRSGRHKIFHQKAGGGVDVVTRFHSEPTKGETVTTQGKQTTSVQDRASVKLEQKEPVTSHAHRTASLPPSDENLVREFLTGEYCITGGTGWWKHEFCFNKVVHQFHEDRKKPKITVTLGHWDRHAHLKWLQDNPSKRPKELKSRKSISHFYTQGDICDITKKPRTVEVKLKCKENPSHPQSVSIYLVEPTPCEYILVVESPVMCPLIVAADENALVDDFVTKMTQPTKQQQQPQTP